MVTGVLVFYGTLLGSRLLVALATLVPGQQNPASAGGNRDLIQARLILSSRRIARRFSTNNVLHKSVYGKSSSA
jgi:hypothetical protein